MRLGTQFEFSPNKVFKELKNNGVQMRSKEEGKFRIHNIPDERYFQYIDSSEKAYILGMLYADGNISKSGKGSCTISLALHLKDRDILEKISMNIYGFIFPFAKKKDADQLIFDINSRKMYDDLNANGCFPCKSLILQFPSKEIIGNTELMWHFLRGYLDGDGCSSETTIYKYPTISFISSSIFIEGLVQFLTFQKIECTKIQYLKSNSKVNPTNEKLTASITFSKRETVKQLYSLIYQNDTISMDRKRILKDKALLLFEDGDKNKKSLQEKVYSYLKQLEDASFFETKAMHAAISETPIVEKDKKIIGSILRDLGFVYKKPMVNYKILYGYKAPDNFKTENLTL